MHKKYYDINSVFVCLFVCLFVRYTTLQGSLAQAVYKVNGAGNFKYCDSRQHIYIIGLCA